MIKPGKAALWVVLASSTTTVMAGSIIAPVLGLMGEGLGVDPGAARLIITTHGILIAICSPFIGSIVDRIGVRKPFLLGLALYGLAGGSGLIINTYWLIIASRVLLGIGVATVFTCNTVVVLNLYEGDRRNKVMGWRATGNSIGGVLWPLLGGALGTISWHMPFGVYLIGLPLALVTLFTLPEVHKRAETTPGEAAAADKISAFRMLLTKPVCIMVYVLVFVANVFLYSIVLFLPKLVEQFGVTSTFLIGIFVALTALAGGGTSLVYAKIKARFSYKTLVLSALALWMLAFIVMSQAFSIWSVVFSVACFGIGLGIVLPTVPLWLGEMVPLSFRGRMSSYIATFSFIGQFMSSIFFSPVASSLGLSAVYLIVSIVSAALFLLFLLIIRGGNGVKEKAAIA